MTYTHPPTRCDRSLFLDDSREPLPITAEDITKLVAWYERSWQTIADALPVTVGGTTYSPRWQERFDYETLPQWREGQLGKQSVAYVYLALRRLFRGLES